MALKVLKVFFWIGIGIVFFFPINASDFYHHLNTGRDIWQTHALPYTDTHSFTAQGKPWVAYAWGTGIIYYALYTTVGPVGISMFTAAIGIATVWFLLKIAHTIEVPRTLSYPLVLLLAGILSLRWPTRPEVFSPFFLSIVLYIITGSSKLNPWIIGIFFVWGLLYGSSTFLGIAVLVLFVVLVSNRKLQDSLITALSALAACANGYGLSSFLYILQIPAIAPHTGEWLPMLETVNPIRPDLALFYQWQVVSVLVLTALVFFAALKTAMFIKKTPRVWLTLILATAILAPYKSVRFINLAPVLVSSLLYIAFSSLKEKTIRFATPILWILAVGIATVRFATFTVGTGEEFSKKPMLFLRSHGIAGHIMSIQEMGAIITWELPDSRILYDTRDDLYQPTGIFSEVQSLDEGKGSIDAFIRKYDITVIIADMTTGSIYKPLLYSDAWALVYTTDGFFIMVDKQIASEKKIAIYDAVDPIRSPPAKPGMTDRAYLQLIDLQQLDPSSVENAVRLAEMDYALHKTDKLSSISKVVSLPHRFGVRSSIETVATSELLGKYAIATADCTRAKKLLETAERSSYGKLIFSPGVRLPNSTDRYLGQYYQTCENNPALSRDYYMKFLKSTNNPLEKRAVEQLINSL